MKSNLRILSLLAFITLSYGTILSQSCPYPTIECGQRNFNTTQTPSNTTSPTSFSFSVIDLDGNGGGLSFSWHKVVNGNCQSIANANGSTYNTPTITESTSYQCQVRIGSNLCYVFYFYAAFVAPPPPPTPVTSTVYACGSGQAQLQVNYDSRSYQWRERPGGALLTAGGMHTLSTGQSYVIGGQGNSILTIYHGGQTASLSFDVTYQNSTPAVISLNVLPPATVSVTPSGPLKICNACSALLTSSAGTDYAHQWKKDGVAITTATGRTYAATQSGNYTVFIQGYSCNTATSNTVVLTKNTLPVVDAGPDGNFYTFSSFLLKGAATDADGTISSYSWQKMSGPSFSFQDSHSALINLTQLPEGMYTFRLTATDNNGDTGFDDVVVYISKLDNNRNQIITTTVLSPHTNEAMIEQLPKEGRSVNHQYFDGIGRVEQIVDKAASSAGFDIIQPIVMNDVGIQPIKYLPYVSQTSSDGWFHLNPVGGVGSYGSSIQHDFYNSENELIPQDINPFSVTIFDNSPLNRPMKQGAEGAQWQPGNNHAIQFSYKTNEEGEVRLIKFNSENMKLVHTPTSYYAANQLYVQTVLDENQHEVTEYKDKEGKVVLKKVEGDTNNGQKRFAITYYVYDDLGNLSVVLPPEAYAKLFSDL